MQSSKALERIFVSCGTFGWKTSMIKGNRTANCQAESPASSRTKSPYALSLEREPEFVHLFANRDEEEKRRVQQSYREPRFAAELRT